MADNLGAAPYDYKDYYGPYMGADPSKVAPGMSVTDKLRGLFGMLGGDTSPVSPRSTGVGDKLRYGLGLAPIAAPAAVAAPAASIAPPPITPIPPTAPVAKTMGAQNPAAMTSPSGMTAADIRGDVIPPNGTGAFVNNATGKVTNLDSRAALAATARGPGATPAQWENRAVPGSLASFFGAAMNQRHLAGQEEAARATALKLPEFLKTQAETAKLTEIQRLAAAETDPAKKAAILGGYSPPAAEKTVFPAGAQPFDKGYLVGTRGGAAFQVPITQPATESDIAATMAGGPKGTTRAQAIQQLRLKGRDTSQFEAR